MPLCLLFTLCSLRRYCRRCQGECASNPKSKQTCSGDRMIQMEGSSPLVSWPRPAGVCGTGTDTNGTKTTMCACQPGYTAGLACEYITRAGRFDHEHDTTLNTSGMLDMSDWVYVFVCACASGCVCVCMCECPSQARKPSTSAHPTRTPYPKPFFYLFYFGFYF